MEPALYGDRTPELERPEPAGLDVPTALRMIELLMVAQNLPKRSSTFEPRQCTTPTAAPLTINIRLAFVCSSPLMRLVCADYCQMEVRVFALLAGERSLLDESQKADVYAQLAVRIFDLPSPAMVSDAQREKAKTLSLAIIYGMVSTVLPTARLRLMRAMFRVPPPSARVSRALESTTIHFEPPNNFARTSWRRSSSNMTCVSASIHQVLQFPKMRQFISSTIARCRSCGYVMVMPAQLYRPPIT